MSKIWMIIIITLLTLLSVSYLMLISYNLGRANMANMCMDVVHTIGDAVKEVCIPAIQHQQISDPKIPLCLVGGTNES